VALLSFVALLIGFALGAAAVAAALLPRLATLRTILANERAREGQTMAMVAEEKSRLGDRFRALSAEALRANNEQFLALARVELGAARTGAGGDLELRQQALIGLVDPLRESLARVDGRLERLERDRLAGSAQLTEQLRALMQSNERLRGETGALVSALRQPHARGRWGEMQLRRVVEIAGMTAHCDFVEQRTVDGEAGPLRPDLVVRLPGGKQVVIDAKAPLQSFLDACEASGEEARQRHLGAHARLLRTHMRQLSAKAYWAQFDSAPDFVLMFLPGEHFHQAALEVVPELIEEGVRQQVMIATPMTLITLLRAVSYGWQQERVAESAREISQAGRELHSRLGLLVERLDGLGRRLSGAVGAYNETVGTLQSRVLPSARRLSEHGAVGDGDELAPPRLVTSAARVTGPTPGDRSDPN
jgi:DNA recombination protein RmuC